MSGWRNKAGRELGSTHGHGGTNERPALTDKFGWHVAAPVLRRCRFRHGSDSRGGGFATGIRQWAESFPSSDRADQPDKRVPQEDRELPTTVNSVCLLGVSELFSLFRHREPQATLYHDHFVDPESGLDTITPLESGTLGEMLDAAAKLAPKRFASCFIRVGREKLMPSDIRKMVESRSPNEKH